MCADSPKMQYRQSPTPLCRNIFSFRREYVESAGNDICVSENGRSSEWGTGDQGTGADEGQGSDKE
jgi:hypothetical protein